MDIPGWLADTFGDVTLGAVIIWATLIAVVIYLIRKAWPGMRAIVQAADLWAKLGPFMADTTAKIERLRAQVENDHQTNLRDEVTDALSKLDAVQASMEGMHGRVDSIEASNERQEQSIEAVRGEVIVVQEKLTRDHQRLNVLEDTIPKKQLPPVDGGE